MINILLHLATADVWEKTTGMGAAIIVFLGLLFFLVLMITRMWKPLKYKLFKSILIAGISIELIVAGLYVIPSVQIPIEYIGAYQTERVAEQNELVWYTFSGSRDQNVPDAVALSALLQIDTSQFELNTDRYSYLLVYGHREVTLRTSLWNLRMIGGFPPDFFFFGEVNNSDENNAGMIYLFRFTKYPIVRYGRF